MYLDATHIVLRKLHRQHVKPSCMMEPLHSCPTGKVSEEIVLLHVDSAMQRVGTSAVLPRGHLISGLQQWIGISVVSRHDSVTDASLVLRALGALESAPTGSGSVPLSLETEPAWIQPINSTSGRILAFALETAFS